MNWLGIAPHPARPAVDVQPLGLTTRLLRRLCRQSCDGCGLEPARERLRWGHNDECLCIPCARAAWLIITNGANWPQRGHR